jgi:C4-dicarboxylate-specific signal transduction histidine kinase
MHHRPTRGKIPVSPTLLEWVLENLMKNALDAMEGRGSITRHHKRCADQCGDRCKRYGQGHQFLQFAKSISAGFTTKKRGWGLGLSLSKRIVEQYHKGQLFVKQSEPGKGTTFRIILPRGRFSKKVFGNKAECFDICSPLKGYGFAQVLKLVDKPL